MMQKNNNIDCIMFDCFGVLLSEVSPVWMSAKFSPDMLAEIEETVKLGDAGKITDTEVFAKLGKACGEAPEQVKREWLSIPQRNEELLRLIPELRKQYKTVLLSNAISNFVESLLPDDYLDELFDIKIISYKTGLIKPEPEIYRYALEKCGTAPERTVFTDDNPKNIQAACNEGIKGIVFRNTEDFLKKLNNI